MGATIAQQENPLLASALVEIAAGHRVFPLHTPVQRNGETMCSCGQADCGSIGKHPRTKDGFKSASKNTPVVTAWWERTPTANVGIETGTRSDCIVLDEDQADAIRTLEERYGRLPETLTSMTGSGGRHLLFRHPGGGAVIPNTTKLDGIPGLDVRGDGGYIVAPPSLHVSGNRYAWINPGTEIAEAPAWLVELLARKSVPQPPAGYVSGDTPLPLRPPVGASSAESGQFWLDRYSAQAGEGNRNDTGKLLAIQLRDSGLSQNEAQSYMTDYAQRVDGLGKTRYSEREATMTLRSIYSQPAREPAKSQTKPLRQQPRTNGTSAYQDDDYGAPEDEPEQPAKRKRFSLMTLDDVKAMPPPEWMIDGILPMGVPSVLYGEHASFKSFLAWDWGMCVSTGTPWLGHAVKQLPVIYIAGEGISGMGKRSRAWEARNTGLNPAQIWLIGEAPQLLNMGDMNDLIATLHELPIKPGLVFIDTLSRSLAGKNENDQADMSLAIASADRIIAEFGCHVMMLHHKPHGQDRARGSTVLPGAVDTEISVTRDNDTVTVVCKKQKNWGEFETITLRREIVSLDDFGDETSCVLLPVDATQAKANARKREASMPKSAQIVLDIMRQEPLKGHRYSDLEKAWTASTTMDVRSLPNGLARLEQSGNVEQRMGFWWLSDE